LDDIASGVYYAAPQDIARLGFAVAHEINAEAPAVVDLTDAVQMRAAVIAQFLRKARRPLVISGTGCGSEAVIQAAANIVRALDAIGRKAVISYVVPEANSLGMAMLSEHGLDEAIAQIETNQADTVVILENDLFARVSRDKADRLFKAARNVVALDHVTTETTDLAHLVLPVGTFAESDGTFINNEGRAQRFIQVLVPEGEILESWRWIGHVTAIQSGSDVTRFSSFDNVIDALTDSLPALAGVRDTGPPAEYRQHWMKIARQPHRYSGRTAMSANVTMHEPPPPVDPDSPMEFSMEGLQSKPDLPVIPRFWWPGWNSVQSLNKFQSEIAGPLVGGNPGVRLIEPPAEPTRAFYDQVPQSFEPRSNAWQFVSLYHVFGSEELSVLSPGIAERSPKPYVGLSPEDAAILGAGEEDLMVAKLDRSYELPLRIIPGLTQGVAGLPVGLPGLTGIDLPAWGEIRAAERDTV
jgi:NADH-quinone oxidoreductase subunit G